MGVIMDIWAKLPTMALFHRVAGVKAVDDALWDAVGEATLLLHKEVVQRTPVDRDRLRSGITIELHRGTPVANHRGVVGTNADIKYARPVETGSRPHWPPITPLLGWARRVLGSERAAYAVQRAIARRGTKGHWMFRDGLAAARPQITRLITQAQQRLRARLMR